MRVTASGRPICCPCSCDWKARGWPPIQTWSSCAWVNCPRPPKPMPVPEITYGELFSFLSGLGFQQTTGSALDAVWRHPRSGAVLVFSLAAPKDTARGADLLSAEVRLQHHGLLEGSIRGAI